MNSSGTASQTTHLDNFNSAPIKQLEYEDAVAPRYIVTLSVSVRSSAGQI